MENKKTALLVIDMQNDFCDKENGTLYVNGAENDIENLKEFIIENGKEIDNIFLTQDSHIPFSIFFSSWWETKDGKEVAPYTTITLQDVKDGVYIPKHLHNSKKFGDLGIEWETFYLEEIEKNSKNLIVWPTHCLRGSIGEAIVDNLFKVVSKWSCGKMDQYHLLKKGECPWSEQYSVFETLVPVNTYPITKPNIKLIETLDENYERIYVAGEAMNYCVKETLASIIELRPSMVKKLVIMQDCMSAIGEFDIDNDDVFKKIKEFGGFITTHRYCVKKEMTAIKNID